MGMSDYWDDGDDRSEFAEPGGRSALRAATRNNPPAYLLTVDVDRSVPPTESGSWLYFCKRCGATAWSGC